jgi:hypothetical protein
MSARCPSGEAPSQAPLPDNNKEARMARALTLSALYLVAIATLFGAYAFAG